MSNSSTSQLSKEISSFDYLSIGFGSMIGVGWIIVLGDWLAQAGPMGAILAFGTFTTGPAGTTMSLEWSQTVTNPSTTATITSGSFLQYTKIR